MILFYQPQISDGITYLDPTESKHCTKVLRKREGDLIHITDGKGFLYHCVVTEADMEKCAFAIKETFPTPPRSYAIHIAISPTKNADRIEWFVEKAVEIGVDSITLIHCDHTERSREKFERLEKIAISAMKQSLKYTLPLLKGPIDFADLVADTKIDERLIAYVDSSNPLHLKDAATAGVSSLVLIGPEGDFSSAEIKLAEMNGFKKVSLGASRLRTETAGIAACHILNLVNTP